MKKLRITLGMIALFLGVLGASAFRLTDDPAWAYDGSGDPTVPGSYSKITGTLPNCGVTKEIVCYIIAPAQGTNPDRPVIDQDLENDINQALTEGEDVLGSVILKPEP